MSLFPRFMQTVICPVTVTYSKPTFSHKASQGPLDEAVFYHLLLPVRLKIYSPDGPWQQINYTTHCLLIDSRRSSMLPSNMPNKCMPKTEFNCYLLPKAQIQGFMHVLTIAQVHRISSPSCHLKEPKPCASKGKSP